MILKRIKTIMRQFKKYFGFYRAKVVAVDLEDAPLTDITGSSSSIPPGKLKDYGAIKVSIDDIMREEFDKDYNYLSNGLVAYPANNPLGGRSWDDPGKTSYYHGSVYVPPLHSNVLVFFEGGSLDHPYYMCAWNSEETRLPPEQLSVDEPHKVYTILKTREGRCIVVSDDVDSQRIEINGKIRMDQGADPSGADNLNLPYVIDNNKTTILFDERSGTEKILIRTYKGDYIHIDIDERQLQMQFEGNINIKSNGSLSVDVKNDIHIRAGKSINIQSGEGMNLKSGSQTAISSSNGMHLNSNGAVRIDGSRTSIQSGITFSARNSNPTQPVGNRDT